MFKKRSKLAGRAQSPEEMRDLLFQFAQMNNLSLIIEFHNEFQDYLTSKVVALDKSVDAAHTRDQRIDRKHQASTYGDVYGPMLRQTTFLLMYSHAEEWLYQIWRTYAKEYELEPRKGSIRRFKKVVKNALGVDVKHDTNWQVLCGSEIVRDCLLHANGRVSMMRAPGIIEGVVRRRKGLLEINKDRLRISTVFLQLFKAAFDGIMGAAYELAREASIGTPPLSGVYSWVPGALESDDSEPSPGKGSD
jgi:hypothetical protein